MEEFLLKCRRTVEVGTGDAGVHVVLGNESCDLDSMVCALTYAYFLSKTHSASLSLPLLSGCRGDLLLRPDSVALLQQVSLPVDLLLFREQVDLKALHREGRLQITLVDHNLLPSSDSELEAAVVEVIDHHLLERSPSPSCSVTVETVGSCATLVTERIISKAPEILDRQIAELLYAAVLVDCVNMSPSAGKATGKDCDITAALQQRFPSLPARDAIFTSLNTARFTVAGLNTEQMLLKDMKALTGSLNLAVSILYISLEDFLEGEELEAELSGFSLKFGFDVLLLSTIRFTESNEPIRELAVFSDRNTCRQQVSLYLEQADSPALGLRPISSRHPRIAAYQQGNALASRKKLLPLLRDFLERGGGCRGDEEEEEGGPAVPPTPANSLVDGCPLDHGPPSPQHLQDKVSKMAARTHL